MKLKLVIVALFTIIATSCIDNMHPAGSKEEAAEPTTAAASDDFKFWTWTTGGLRVAEGVWGAKTRNYKRF